MNELKVFENEEFGSIRTAQLNNETYFCASDVAKALGYKKPNDAILQHCRATVKHSTPISGKMQEINFIPESDLYRLIFKSQLESAERFTDWVTEDVLPSIRKTGTYSISDTKHLLAIAVLEANKMIEEKDQRIAEMRPKEIFADAVSASESSIAIGDLAKTLNQNGVDIGRNRLFEALRSDGYLIKGGADYNSPTQKAMDRGLFEVKLGSYVDGNGVNVVTKTTKVTGKGLQYFINKFLEKQHVA